jgi:protein-disulfide isomerase
MLRVLMARAATAASLLGNRCAPLPVLGLLGVMLALLAPSPKLAYASATSDAIAHELNGIPQSGNRLGDPNAPVTLQYFGDLECPICRDFELGVLPELVSRYVREGRLKVEYRSLETATRQPEMFRTQQVAALAAGRQDKMWYFVELFYREQGEEGSGYVTESYLQNLAQQVPGLDLATWTSDRNDPALANQVTSDAQAANNAGFEGTPSFLIGKRGARLHKLELGPFDGLGPFEAAVKRLLRSD